MARRKDRYIAHLVFPEGRATREIYADLTLRQAEILAAWLEKEKRRGAIQDFYLGPPQRMEHIHTMFFNAQGLRNELQSIIEDHERLSE